MRTKSVAQEEIVICDKKQWEARKTHLNKFYSAYSSENQTQDDESLTTKSNNGGVYETNKHIEIEIEEDSEDDDDESTDTECKIEDEKSQDTDNDTDSEVGEPAISYLVTVRFTDLGVGEYEVNDAIFSIASILEVGKLYKFSFIVGQRVPLGIPPKHSVFIYVGPMDCTIILPLPLKYEGFFEHSLDYLSPNVQKFIRRYFQKMCMATTRAG